MIITLTAYCPENEGTTPKPGRDYGYAINQQMERLQDDDWAFIIDHDTYLLTRYWFRQLENAIREIPDAGCFTVMRYPAVNLWAVPQELNGITRKQEPNIAHHRDLAHTIGERYKGKIQDVTDYELLKPPCPTAGIFLLSKKNWSAVGGFIQGHKEEHIDYDMHNKLRDLGKRAYLLRDFYMFHAKHIR